MNENFLQYIWRTGLFDQVNLKTVTGDDVQVIKRGHLNTGSGPDFSEARIRIGEADWVGHVEIHIKASDWYNHRHHLDPAYNNTVLHVVYDYDKEAQRQDGSHVPCIVIRERISAEIIRNYDQLQQSGGWIICEAFMPAIDGFTKSMMMEKALVQRMEEKSDAIMALLAECSNDWQTAFYITLAKNFGLNINAASFDMLARALPLKLLAKHKHNLLQTEALLFGTAGFLENAEGDEYYQKLRSEHIFLKKKYSLQTLPTHIWKHMRLRPANFPELRLAQFAALIHASTHLFSKILETEKPQSLQALFALEVSPYWQQHYRFGTVAKNHVGHLSQATIDLLLINTVVPFLFGYGRYMNDQLYKDRSVALLQDIKPESNAVISHWEVLNVKPQNAFDSQALLQQKQAWCDVKRCLYCAVGNKILQRKG